MATAVPLDTVSFSGGGWFQMYHFGVAQALLDAGCVAPHDAESPTRFVGSSAGALVAAALAGDLNIIAMRDFALDCGDHVRARPWRLFGQERYIVDSVRKFASDIMSRDERSGNRDVERRLQRTLEVYATALPTLRPVVLTGFKNITDAIEALRASCCLVPVVVGMPVRLRATREFVVDGGLCAFQPRAGEMGVVTVSAAPLEPCDIKPSLPMPYLWTLRPPRRVAHRAIFDVGYRDAVTYLAEQGFISSSRRDMLHRGANVNDVEALKARLGSGNLLLRIESFVVFFISVFIIRPLAILALYLEMCVSLAAEAALAVYCLRPPETADGGKWQSAEFRRRVKRSTDIGRNLLSLPMFVNLALGGTHWMPVEIDEQIRHSIVYKWVKTGLRHSSWRRKNATS